MTTTSTDIVIVGGGASGVLLAAQLLRRGPDTLQVTVVERRADVGPGLAYSTVSQVHMLNTRAGDMSARAEEPGDFVRWLCLRNRDRSQQDFMPRVEYGDYLRAVWASTLVEASGRLRLVNGEAQAVRSVGDGVRLDVSGADPVHCRLLVLATGHRPPSPDSGAFRGNPWAPDILNGLDPSGRVLLIGTGLTMIDVLASLMAQNHVGPILAVSRRGLVPRPHSGHPAPVEAPPVDALFDGTLSSRLRRFRTLMRSGKTWEALMQALRPRNQALWRSLSESEQRRFLRHLRPWWDVHRHRVAPEPFGLLNKVKNSGQLAVMAGRLRTLDQSDRRIRVEVTGRGSGQPDVRLFDCVIDCRGPANSIDTDAPLHVQMLANGLLRPDSLGLGFAVDDNDALISDAGLPSARIHAFGPPTRGHHWEITAIPDIRSRAARLATHLLDKLKN